ncbi:MAG: hypothetical protein K9H64_23470 [Bacteroidales bacterium]|nr:hypothetical protein [Bacteroidales bacterium]MCF8458992.1 hypothetical protein [Bacteroidales bacterium]
MKIKTVFLIMMFVATGSLLSAQGLKVEPGLCIKVESGTTLDISGGGDLLLESDATGDASVIDLGSVSYTGGGEANVERYLTQGEYHYISSPVSNQNISPEFVNTTSNPLPSTVDFYKFDEPYNMWRNIKDGSGNLNNSFETQFVVNLGYAYANNLATSTKTFTGALNNTSQTVNLTRTIGTGSEGWNLVGNPYPAPLAAGMYLISLLNAEKVYTQKVILK